MVDDRPTAASQSAPRHGATLAGVSARGILRRSLPRPRGIAAALLLGLLLTIAGSWLPAHLILQQEVRWQGDKRLFHLQEAAPKFATGFGAYRQPQVGATPFSVYCSSLEWPDEPPDIANWPQQPAVLLSIRGIGYEFSDARSISYRPLYTTYSQAASCFGWPLPALRLSISKSSFGAVAAPAGIWERRWREGVELPLLGRVPMRPDWPPLLFNWAVFTVLVCLIIMLLGWRRDRRRRRRGLCAACAYPLMELSRCPECGLASSRAQVL